jgi:hypothetical protein
VSDTNDLLKELADEPDGFQRSAGDILFTRLGKEVAFSLKNVPGSGTCVVRPDFNPVPLNQFIQNDILELPRMASQIAKALRYDEKTHLEYIDGTARVTRGFISEIRSAKRELLEVISNAEMGTTQIVLLMADAGAGKTVLLEELARKLAQGYQALASPVPILVPVDLLGRYVGTIDDAVAGTLNNRFRVPSLPQKDVICSMRNYWLVLALDGFDELVARVGTRSAFIHINNIVNQLKGAGTIVLSARTSFFDSHNIELAFREYVNTTDGTFRTISFHLEPWGREQGLAAFRQLGSTSPEVDFDSLLRTFNSDMALVCHPFFLARLAALWRDGERFEEASQTSLLLDTWSKYRKIIELLITRELKEKWIEATTGLPILSWTGHCALLGRIAEEMWRTGAFKLDKNELELATLIALDPLPLSSTIKDQVKDRIMTHAALTTREHRYSFKHEHFLSFFLGYRLAECVYLSDVGSIEAILCERELSPEVLHWTILFLKEFGLFSPAVLTVIQKVSNTKKADTSFSTNLGQLAGFILQESSPEDPIEISGAIFNSNQLSGATVDQVLFTHCQFINSDLSGARISSRFHSCNLVNVLVDENTSFIGSLFDECKIIGLSNGSENETFVPSEAINIIHTKGGQWIQPPNPLGVAVPEQAPQLGYPTHEYIRIVSLLVRRSAKMWDLATEDMIEKYGELAQHVFDIGLENGVFKQVEKETSGSHKTFFRFSVNKAKLLEGSGDPTIWKSDSAIGRFWNALRQQ